jgi:hypothetical protein
VEQGAHRLGAGLVAADLAAQAQGFGALARPDARRLPRGGQVVVGADLIEVVVDVKARRDRHLSQAVTSSPMRRTRTLVSRGAQRPDQDHLSFDACV